MSELVTTERANETIEVGHMLMIEFGAYTDVQWQGPVRVLRQISKRAVSERFLAECIPYPGVKKASPSQFLPWLIEQGYVEPVENVSAWQVGYYDAFDEE